MNLCCWKCHCCTWFGAVLIDWHIVTLVHRYFLSSFAFCICVFVFLFLTTPFCCIFLSCCLSFFLAVYLSFFILRSCLSFSFNIFWLAAIPASLVYSFFPPRLALFVRYVAFFFLVTFIYFVVSWFTYDLCPFFLSIFLLHVADVSMFASFLASVILSLFHPLLLSFFFFWFLSCLFPSLSFFVDFLCGHEFSGT